MIKVGPGEPERAYALKHQERLNHRSCFRKQERACPKIATLGLPLTLTKFAMPVVSPTIGHLASAVISRSSMDKGQVRHRSRGGLLKRSPGRQKLQGQQDKRKGEPRKFPLLQR
jgi:hypothetical protein